MRSRGIAWESYEESDTVIIIINKAGRLETYIYRYIYVRGSGRDRYKIYRRSVRTNNIITI